MNRLLATLRHDVALQFRYGFYYVGGFVALVWLVVLSYVPAANLALLLPGMLIIAMLITTYYFVAALALLEKEEGTLAGLVVTPLRDSEYLAAKVTSLTVLAMLETCLIVVLVYGVGFRPLWLLAGLFLMGVIYTAFGFVAIARYDSINEYLLPSVVFTTLLTLPLVDYFGLWRSAVFYLHPLQPPLLLLHAAFDTAEPWQLAYGLLGSLAWAAFSFTWARHAFRRFIICTAGD